MTQSVTAHAKSQAGTPDPHQALGSGLDMMVHQPHACLVPDRKTHFP
jgi:hypothetical protein